MTKLKRTIDLQQKNHLLITQATVYQLQGRCVFVRKDLIIRIMIIYWISTYEGGKLVLNLRRIELILKFFCITYYDWLLRVHGINFFFLIS